MAGTTTATAKKQIDVEFTVAGKIYVGKVNAGFMDGNFAGFVGYTKSGKEPTAGAIRMSRAAMLENAVLLKLVAEGRKGSRTSYRTIYVPRDKVEEAVKDGGSKTLGGGFNIVKVRGPRRRIFA